MKYNTILFKDSINRYYIGTMEQGKITKLNHLQVPPPYEQKIRDMLSETMLNEFLIVTVDEGTENDNSFIITPITCCTLTASDSEEEIAPNLCEMGHDRLLDMLNSLIPENLLKDKHD